MALPVMIIGASGSGKTYSLKQFKKGEIGVISAEKNRLPFKSDIKPIKIPSSFSNEEINSYAQLNAAKYSWLQMSIRTSPFKSIILDDSQYILSGEFFDRAKEKGYDKFVDIAANFRNLIHFINELPDDDKIVYFLHHCETDANGREKIKTIGKMLDEKLTVEGCFDVVMYCSDYKFFTQSNGQSSAKTPEGMFAELEIPNDLKAVDTTIRDYYGMKKLEVVKDAKR